MSLRNATRSGRVLRCLAGAAVVVAATAAGSLALPGTASATEFASAGDAKVHPGVKMESSAGQCTSNFIFTNQRKIFIGQAAHCTGKGNATETDGCTSDSLPVGSKIDIEGATRPGILAYSSWITMQDEKEKDADICAYNDFALVEIDPDDYSRTNPSVPKFGGPTGLRQQGLPKGTRVYTFGNSQIRQGIGALSPKTGVALGDSGGGWTHSVSTPSPGIPGDSGSGFLDGDGRAFGVLSTLSVAPLPGTNGVSDLAKAMDYASDNGKLGTIEMVLGTEGFKTGGGLPLL